MHSTLSHKSLTTSCLSTRLNLEITARLDVLSTQMAWECHAHLTSSANKGQTETGLLLRGRGGHPSAGKQ